MVGDVNLFILDARSARDEYWGGAGEGGVAEVMVMVGEPRARRRGFAREAVAGALRYGAERLGVRGFVAKISEDNAASRALFAGLGFVEAKRVPAFAEVHCVLEWRPEEWAGAYRVEPDPPAAGSAEAAEEAAR
jgi:RimJ/RimL family protein N-acetyltransferase